MVFYSPDTIDLRANWEINQRLKIPTEVESLPDLDSMDRYNINRKTPPVLDP